MCLYTRYVKNPKYKENKKNGGVIPPVSDSRVLYVPIGCGKCIECRKQKARGWQLRLLEDIKNNKNGKFVTLTFSNESITKLVEYINNDKIQGYDLDNQIATTAVRLFLERWRKKYKKSVRHWLVTELGHKGTENIHMHGIIWTDEKRETVQKIWNYGHIWYGDNKKHWVNAQTINYIIKYVHKQDEIHKYYQSIILTSAGIGRNYSNTPHAKLNRYKGDSTIDTYRTEQGYKISLPTYWRNKIYTEEEREKLWIHKLDKNERWICGEKIAADDDKALYELLKYYRKRNKELGYGSHEKDWNRIEYEKVRRILLQQKRMGKIEKEE